MSVCGLTCLASGILMTFVCPCSKQWPRQSAVVGKLATDGLGNPEFRKHIEAIAEKSSKTFLVFVNGREGLATCNGWRPDHPDGTFDTRAQPCFGRAE